MTRFVAVLLVACNGCNEPLSPPNVVPPAPAPSNQPAAKDAGTGPTPAPTPPDDGCAASCENQHRLKCPEWSPTCPERCRKADAELVKLHSAPSNHACTATAQSCEASRACP